MNIPDHDLSRAQSYALDMPVLPVLGIHAHDTGQYSTLTKSIAPKFLR